MGIHGILKEIGPGQRISLAKLSSQHYAAHSRPLRIAIDISIWLFQIQSGKGGSNPALRTFYYRLLRLMTLNIHPLFVFDGPNKPLFKRNKKVGGPGVRVATVPEFLAKQLLKQFGFPWHVAPGEAEAECALLQREDIVDAVLSEDADTLMFGSGTTLRNWTAEGSTKTPTHVNFYRALETKEKSGLDREGMILVALMSGGDYIPEGIPGCGPKVACDAARAGFGKELCALGKRDVAGFKAWRERLQLEIATNQSKFFTRKNKSLAIPEDFPNQEVLGYYTHPCISNTQRLDQLRGSLRWDQDIDFAALRSFAGDAFDWRCVGGAKKFIRNLAPAMLVRNLRLRAESAEELDPEAQEALERGFINLIHGKRTHFTSDGELEMRISFVPCKLVPIDLSVEEEDDQFLPAGGEQGDSDTESEFATIPTSTPVDSEEEIAPATKKRTMRPYDPSQPEKLWILRDFLKLGCPLLVEDYEASQRDGKALLQQRAKERAAKARRKDNIQAPKPKASRKKKDAAPDMPVNSLMRHVRVTKAASEEPGRAVLQDMPGKLNGRPATASEVEVVRLDDDDLAQVSRFKLPSTQIPDSLMRKYLPPKAMPTIPSSSQPAREDNHSFFAPFTASQQARERREDLQRTPPRRKRRSSELATPKAAGRAAITTYFSPTPKKNAAAGGREIISLLSSSPIKAAVEARQLSPSPQNLRHRFMRTTDPDESDDKILPLPKSVTKRRKKGGLSRSHSAPVNSEADVALDLDEDMDISNLTKFGDVIESIDLASPLPKSTTTFGRFAAETSPGIIDLDLTPRPIDRRIAVPSLTRENSYRAQASEDAIIRLDSSLPTPPAELSSDDDLPDCPISLRRTSTRSRETSRPSSHARNQSVAAPLSDPQAKPKKSAAAAVAPSVAQASSSVAVHKAVKITKKRIQLRQSLEGSWKEMDEAEALDLTGDGSGYGASKGKAKIKGWRKSGVEVLDLTGA